MSKKPTIKLEDMVDIKGITKNQETVIKEYKRGKCLFLYGSAGTGKTFITLYHSLKEVLDPKTKYPTNVLGSLVRLVTMWHKTII